MKINLSTFTGIAGIIALLFLLVFSAQVVETVDKGTFHVKQAAVSGTITAHTETGIYFQNFGTVEKWPTAETFRFTADKDSEEDTDVDSSIEVRFSDGSMANISGTLRVSLPKVEVDITKMVNEENFKDYLAVESKLIMPAVRAALRHTANMMTARESYSERRNEFMTLAWDQIQFGLYHTEEYTEEAIDPISGMIGRVKRVRLLKDNAGEYLRSASPITSVGIRLTNFEVKEFRYEKRVLDQITKQQAASMAVATAKAEAQRAEQDAITKEAEGKALVMEAKYVEEQKKVVAVTQAEQKVAVAIQAKEEAETKAAALKAVKIIEAEAMKEAAVLTAEAITIEASARKDAALSEADGRRALMEADGALPLILEAKKAIHASWASASAQRSVPTNVFGGGVMNTDGQIGQTSMQMQDTMNLILLKGMGVEGLDLGKK